MLWGVGFLLGSLLVLLRLGGLRQGLGERVGRMGRPALACRFRFVSIINMSVETKRGRGRVRNYV